MRRAVRLARRGAGRVSPNPLVGAVIVRDGRIVGEGWHRAYGGLHAEAEAVRAAEAAGVSVRGADMYCTLEPCCHTGPEKHQPPCTDLLIKSGIRRVFVANRDPNPAVDGRGLEILAKAGVQTRAGLLEAWGEKLNEGFFTFQRIGRPFIRLKIAQSLDGRIAAAGGDAKWITDEAARRRVHRMRARHDAVLIGSGAARIDDPELTVRLVRGRSPVRVVLDSRLSLPDTARLLRPRDIEKTILVCGPEADPKRLRDLASRGVAVLRLGTEAQPGSPSGGGGDLPLREVLTALAGRGIRSVLVEGGGRIFTSFLREDLWDAVTVFIAPVFIGKGVDAVGNLGTVRVRDALRLRGVRTRRIGDQVIMEGENVHGNR